MASQENWRNRFNSGCGRFSWRIGDCPRPWPIALVRGVALILAVQFSAVVAILVISRGTALRGVVIMGGFVAILSLLTSALPVVAFWTSLTAWFGGALTADAESKRRSFFLRWAWLLALIWPLIVVLIEIMTIALR